MKSNYLMAIDHIIRIYVSQDTNKSKQMLKVDVKINETYTSTHGKLNHRTDNVKE